MTTTPHPRPLRAALVTGTLVALGLALGGCSGSSPAPAAPAASTSTAASTSSNPSSASSTAEGSSTATGSTTSLAAGGGAAPGALRANQIEQLVTILEAVNPGMSTDDATLVNGSLQICQQIKSGLSGSALASATGTQFTNGAYTPSPEEVDAIDSAITKTFCF